VIVIELTKLDERAAQLVSGSCESPFSLRIRT